MAEIKILFLGDIVGSAGREAIRRELPAIRQAHALDLIIANGENAAHGFGITPNVADDIFSLGVDLITGGNHIFDKKENPQAFQKYPDRLLRPANFPSGVIGRGTSVVYGKSGEKIGVINLMGRIFMEPMDCPFQAFDREIRSIREQTRIILVDFHAETTSEKIAFSYYIDGQVSALVGTHTHVQTGDERIYPKGMGYLTDAGMNGALDSVIGMKKEIVIERYLKRLPLRNEVAEGPGQLNGVIFTVDAGNGKCVNVERVRKLPS